MSPASADRLIEQLGVHLDPELLVLALTHRSFAHEAGGIPTNERLEFLGDSVLGLGLVVYDVEGTGPDHARTFTARAIVGDQVRGAGTGSSKKLAEQGAAALAYGALQALAPGS